jgi:hypothetical protein
MKSSEYNIKLKKSIEKYKKQITDYKFNRASIIFLTEQITQPSDNKMQDKTCKARKNNGAKCPSVRKKGELYCHRHWKTIQIS